MKRIAFVISVVVLNGCAATMDVTMMARDSGTAYRGELRGDGSGAGTMSVDLQNAKCSGPASRVSSNERSVVGSAFVYGAGGFSSNAFATATISGDATVRALLTCDNGKGLRCELTGRNGNGGGVCANDSGRIFDVVISRK